MTLNDLDKLSVIHVAGTKGKGSVCAFVESILRNYGYKTGFYSSPHLIHVTERIRINGRPIKENLFTDYFWPVYNSLYDKKEDDSDMPTYFKFLTILAFHVFINSDIDVAILEVGIGGEYDCTNVVRNPICVGVTSLGLEHTALLGDTLESIARQKSGIFKEYCAAFTVEQEEEAMKVLRERAKERNCKLNVVPGFESYPWKGGIPILGIPGDIQKSNASLAVQLAHTWIKRRYEKNLISDIENIDSFIVGDRISFKKTAAALSACSWPGRTQILRAKKIDFYLDGAHTSESIEFCASWFEREVYQRKGKRFLIFNVTGNRDIFQLLSPLQKLRFDRVYFVPNIAGDKPKLDQLELQTPSSQQLDKCYKNRDYWNDDNATVFPNISQAFNHIKNESNINDINNEVIHSNRPQVLITGSLHLVGAALLILDPNLIMKTDYL